MILTTKLPDPYKVPPKYLEEVLDQAIRKVKALETLIEVHNEMIVLDSPMTNITLPGKTGPVSVQVRRIAIITALRDQVVQALANAQVLEKRIKELLP